MPFGAIALVMAILWALVAIRLRGPGFAYGFVQGMALGHLIAGLVLLLVH